MRLLEICNPYRRGFRVRSVVVGVTLYCDRASMYVCLYVCKWVCEGVHVFG